MAQPVSRPIENKLSKEEAKYRQYEACKSCGNYQQSGTCMKVEGNISPECVCSMWQMMERLPEVKHAEFYREEYEKSKS